MGKSKHVVHNPNGGWDVKSGGQKISHHQTQKDAANLARSIAKIDGSEVVTHGRDGKIRAKDSYGRDPYPPKG